MSNLLRMLCCFALLGGLILCADRLSAQTFTGEPQTLASTAALSKPLAAWEVYRLDVLAIDAEVKSHPDFAQIILNLGAHHWKLDLTPSGIISENYTVQEMTENGLQVRTNVPNIAFKGYDLNGGGRSRMTIDEDFLLGFTEEGGERVYIEPLWYYDRSAERDLFVVYKETDVIRDANARCAAIESDEKSEELGADAHAPDAPESMSACYVLELAIASDWLMFDEYGSSQGVQDHNVAVINNVQDDYTGNFNHDVQFNIVTQFVVTTSTGNPWSASTNAGTLLDSFRNWGQAGNFGVTFDLGELWTDRDFDGGTVGIAFINSICNSTKYHCLQDFTTNAQLLRCMTSHEIGHNFSCNHDATGCPPDYIMCPFVSTTNVWSPVSITAINNKLNAIIANGCVSPCGPPPVPLVADFDWTPDPGCRNQPVHFTDQSTGNITSRQWTFQSGSPATSTQINPTVTWPNAGTFNVTLTVSGPGTSPATAVKQIIIQPLPVANYTYTVNDLTVTFTNTSTNATDYSWNFGDGFFSTDPNPEHTYDVAGNYIVVLTATNSCGTATKTFNINTFPTPDFSGSPTVGCPGMSVSFANLSSTNATSYTWNFQGGAPSQSSSTNPTVVYPTPGVYSVTLTAYNNTGSNTLTKVGYITVLPQPTAAFTSVVNGLTVNFTSTSTNATSYAWNFGDNGTSTQSNPSHTYAATGTYTVTLTTTNQCGTATATHTVTVDAPPTASFSASPTSGCGPLTVTFTNTSSTNATTFNWQFPGGNPTSSTAQNPTVTYTAPGSYSVTLTASNGAGTNTATQTNLITVNPSPTAGFTSTTNGSTANFTNTSTNATSYSWNFGDSGTSAQNNPSHTYTADGTYTVTLTATGPCGTATSTQTVVIATPPTAGFSASPTTGCGPLTVQFTSTSSTNTATYNWQFPGGTPSSSTAQNPSVTYNNAGTYTVTLTVSNAQGSNTATQTNLVVVNQTPIMTAPANQSACGGTPVSTNFAGTAGAVFNWTNTNTAIGLGASGTGNISFTSANVSAATTGTITVTPVLAGCTGAAQTFTITVNPTPSMPDPADQVVCANAAVAANFTGTPSAPTFAWTNSNTGIGLGASGSGNIAFTAANVSSAQAATITVSPSLGACTGAAQAFTITVNPLAVAGFSSTTNGATATFTNTSTNATTYSWNFGDSGTSGATNPTHTYTADGTYTVTLTATNACGSNTSTHTVVIVTPPTAGFSATPTLGCEPLTVQFTSTSSTNTSTYNWQFPGGNPSTSTAQNPTVTYNTPGSYSVTLTVSNSAGSNTATQTSFINVGVGPTAGFTSAVNGMTATFTNTSSGATSYSWDFGDSNTSTNPNPSHTYSSDGTFTVTLTATNACGSTTFTQTVTITLAPTASFTATPTSGCAPLSVQFTSTSSASATSFNWQFAGGNPSTSTAQNPTVVYNTPGAYSVTLTVGNTAGTSSATQTSFVNVGTTPTAGFTAASNGANASFTNTSTGATSYSWNFGDSGNSTDPNPTHTYTTDGTYTVTLTATNACGSTTATQTVTIVTPPVAQFSMSSTHGCVPFTPTFDNLSSTNATSYEWTFEGGLPSSSSAQTPSVTWTSAGTFVVTLVATNAAGSSTSTTTVTVNDVPAAGFTSATAGLGVVLTNTSTNATSYFWNFGDNTTSTEANPTHDYGSTGTFTVVLRALNECGFTEYSQEVEISGDAPIPAFSAGESKGCAPFTVNFTDQTAGNPTSWNWTFQGGNPPTSTAQNPTVTYNTPGTYDVTLEATNIFGTNTTTQSAYIEVLTTPTAAFTFTTNQATATFTNTSGNADNYIWNFGDGTLPSTDPNPVHTYTQSGTYTVTLTAINLCGASSLEQMVQVVVSGSSEPGWLEQFRVYPNPNAGAFTVEMQGLPQDEVKFTLFNAIGQLISSETAGFGTGNLKRNFDYPGLPAGVYTLGVQAGERVVFVKLTVQ